MIMTTSCCRRWRPRPTRTRPHMQLLMQTPLFISRTRTILTWKTTETLWMALLSPEVLLPSNKAPWSHPQTRTRARRRERGKKISQRKETSRLRLRRSAVARARPNSLPLQRRMGLLGRNPSLLRARAEKSQRSQPRLISPEVQVTTQAWLTTHRLGILTGASVDRTRITVLRPCKPIRIPRPARPVLIRRSRGIKTLKVIRMPIRRPKLEARQTIPPPPCRTSQGPSDPRSEPILHTHRLQPATPPINLPRMITQRSPVPRGKARPTQGQQTGRRQVRPAAPAPQLMRKPRQPLLGPYPGLGNRPLRHRRSFDGVDPERAAHCLSRPLQRMIKPRMTPVRHFARTREIKQIPWKR
jgi:hypothetical protein